MKRRRECNQKSSSFNSIRNWKLLTRGLPVSPQVFQNNSNIVKLKFKISDRSGVILPTIWSFKPLDATERYGL